MKDQKILSIGPLPPEVISKFDHEYHVQIVGESDRAGTLERLDEKVVIIIARGPVYIDEEILSRAPGLLAVARTGVGYDSVSIEDANARKIPILYTPGAMTRAVAEHTMGLILAGGKKLNHWRQALQEGDWDARYGEQNLDLEGAVLGIIGYGRIGRYVRQLCRPFGFEVLADDPYIDHSAFKHDDLTFTGLEEVLKGSDIITLHVPLTEETHRMINSENIHLIRPGSILINTARGAVVESLDLLHRELESGRLEAVCIDVFPDEPPDQSHPLFQHPRAYVTGHVAARTPQAQKAILNTTVSEVTTVLHGRRPTLTNVVNPEVLDGGS